jgi:hypothetical protein
MRAGNRAEAIGAPNRLLQAKRFTAKRLLVELRLQYIQFVTLSELALFGLRGFQSWRRSRYCYNGGRMGSLRRSKS